MRSFKSWFLHALEGRETESDLPERLLAREAFLRIMAAHVRILPSGHEFFVEGQDNLLEAGLRSGVSLPYGCNDASCGACKVKLASGKVRQVRDAAYHLSDDEVRKGNILACCCAAVTDVVLEADEARSSDDITGQTIKSQIYKISRHEDAIVVQAKLGNGERLRFLAGQYARIQLADGSEADCAIASCPCDERSLEFHLSEQANTEFWRYASKHMAEGEELTIRGPKGNFVMDPASTRPLLFVAIDTGFGAVKSLVEHAMALDAAESIHLYRASSLSGTPYLDNLCRSWADALDGFAYTSLRLDAKDENLLAVVDKIAEEYPDLAQHDVYLCAHQDQLQRLGLELENRTGATDQRVNIEPIRT